MIVDKRLNNLANAYCRAKSREFKYLWLKKLMEYMRSLNDWDICRRTKRITSVNFIWINNDS